MIIINLPSIDDIPFIKKQRKSPTGYDNVYQFIIYNGLNHLGIDILNLISFISINLKFSLLKIVNDVKIVYRWRDDVLNDFNVALLGEKRDIIGGEICHFGKYLKTNYRFPFLIKNLRRLKQESLILINLRKPLSFGFLLPNSWSIKINPLLHLSHTQ